MEEWKFDNHGKEMPVLISGQGNKLSKKNLKRFKDIMNKISKEEGIEIQLFHFEIY